jgi:hypothetical protein
MQINNEQFWAGYEAGWRRQDEAQQDPVGVDESLVWSEGWRAAETGMLFCPYLINAGDGRFRKAWLNGYKAGHECMPESRDSSEAAC